MARSTTRSQRQPSQSQPSQSQQLRRWRPNQDEDADADVMDENADDDPADKLNRKANDLVRLALFMEQRRMPLKRDEISKKVLGARSRTFGMVFIRAQEILRGTFGMELVELRNRVEEEIDPDAKQKEAMNIKKKASTAGTKQFILRSTLDPELIERATLPDPEILQLENEEGEEEEETGGVSTRSTGSIFAWQKSDQLASLGVLYTVLALILVNGRSIPDGDLRSQLKRLRLPNSGTVQTTGQSTSQNLTTDAYLVQLIRQGYLDRERIGEKKPGGTKRGRVPIASQTQEGDASGSTWEWKWGPRSVAEIGEVGIAQFVSEFMVQRRTEAVQEDEEDEGEGQLDYSNPRIEKLLETMKSGIEKAAGGKLLDIVGK